MIMDLGSNPDPSLQSWNLGEPFYILNEEMSVKCLIQYLRYSKNLPFIVILIILFLIVVEVTVLP